ncbi:MULTISPECIES: hypothetical protein [Achromobacter]|uniref:hypothetical protein n=1 Tax=Achromobacter TaxID=222 RepID=UPI0012F50FCA|nr:MULTISPECIES: hypothetical protein [Achromobacter]
MTPDHKYRDFIAYGGRNRGPTGEPAGLSGNAAAKEKRRTRRRFFHGIDRLAINASA